MTIRSASQEGASLQKQASYSSLQGHADDTNRTSPRSKTQYPFISDFDYSEGNVMQCTYDWKGDGYKCCINFQ